MEAKTRMPGLFDPVDIGSLSLRNRIMRSATAERLGDPDTGAPLPQLADLYRALAEGEVGLIVTGHAYVERSGRPHPEQCSIADDSVISNWRKTIRPAQEAGARVMMQINHGGASCDPDVTPELLSPSGVGTHDRAKPREMSDEDVRRIVSAFARAAGRAQEAGLDGVQIHGAHGYLVSQFLTPSTNQRQDGWGGDADGRFQMLAAVISEIRREVGESYPVWIKLGVAGGEQHGFHAADGAEVARRCAESGVDCVEISHALGEPEGIRRDGAPPYLPMAETVREAVGPAYPLALVNGFSALDAMQAVVAGETVQMVSLCRPLISEPDLPRKMREGASEEALCSRCGSCWPEYAGEGIACHNSEVRAAVGLPTI